MSRRSRADHQASELAKLAEYDGLFIRETTSIDNHTYRFARRAQQEGMPVIDDPLSMIRCTNKVYLHGADGAQQVPTPPTVMLADADDLRGERTTLGFPLVREDSRRLVFARRREGRDAEELKRLPTSCSRIPTC